VNVHVREHYCSKRTPIFRIGVLIKMEDLKQLITGTRDVFAKMEEQVRNMRCLMGFDAFVDEIAEMVDERQDFEHYTQIETISDFGQRILDAAGLSNSMEMVPRYTKSGGSAVNMGSAVASLGCDVTYIGCIGYPDVDPVFADFASSASRVYNIARPGHTLALEFKDGKIMICNTQPLKEITWDRIVEEVGIETLRQLYSCSQLVGSINWTMTPYMNEIWEKLQTDLLPVIGFAAGDPVFFVDPIDPQKRDNEDIVRAMRILAGFSPYYRVILSLNRKEATEVAKAFNLDLGTPLQKAELSIITQELAANLGFHGLVVHPVDGAAAVIDGEYYEARGPYTSNPKLTTGAGDNFNGGFTLGILLGLDPLQALALGTATSGFYVREARSPGFHDLVGFLGTWAEHAGEEF